MVMQRIHTLFSVIKEMTPSVRVEIMYTCTHVHVVFIEHDRVGTCQVTDQRKQSKDTPALKSLFKLNTQPISYQTRH